MEDLQRAFACAEGDFLRARIRQTPAMSSEMRSETMAETAMPGKPDSRLNRQ